MAGPLDEFGGFWSDDRGVSVPVDYALGLLILLVLSGVFVGGVQQISDAREDAVMKQELDRIGTEVGSSLVEADTLAEEAEARAAFANTGGPQDVEIRISLPSQVNDDSYAVSVDQNGNVVTVTVQSEGYIVETTVYVERTVETGSTGSGDLIITYDASTDSFILESA